MNPGRDEMGQQGDYRTPNNPTKGQRTGRREPKIRSQPTKAAFPASQWCLRSGLILWNPLNVVHPMLKNPSTQEPCLIWKHLSKGETCPELNEPLQELSPLIGTLFPIVPLNYIHLPTLFPWGNQKLKAQVVPKRTRIFGPTGHSLPKRKKEKGGYPDHCLPSPEGQHTPIELGHVYAASLLKMWNSSAISLTDCSHKAQAGCWTPSPGFRIQRVWAGTWTWTFLISFLVTLMLLVQGPSVRTTDLKGKFFHSCEV